MDPHGFEVIDAHHHFDAGSGLGDALDVGAVDGAGLSDAEKELRTRLAIMDAEFVKGAVILAGHTYLRPNGVADTRAVNDAVAAYRDSVPDRFLAAVGVVEPLYGPAIYDEIMRCKDDLGLVGFTFHNGMQGVPIDSRLMCNLIERIAEAGMVPFVHALGNALETLVQVDSLAERFPDVDMVVLDVFHDMGQVYALQSVAERRPNLYFDLALIPGFEFMGLPRVKAIGADRFVYGTDMYSWPMMTKPLTPLLQDILDSDLSDDDKSLILSGNIRRVLTLA